MKRRMIRFLVGFPLGIFLSVILLYGWSLMEGQGTFLAVLPSFRNLVEPEITAFGIQLFLSCIIGSLSISMISLFEREDWSILRICLLHAGCMLVMMLSAAVLLSLAHSSLLWFLAIIGCFLLGMGILYTLRYTHTKKQVQDLNRILREEGK